MSQPPLTSEQQARVFEAIAGRMVTVDRLLMILQGGQLGKFESDTLLDAAQFMAATVGAMADAAIGGDVHGDMNFWLYGPLFVDGSAQGRA